MFKACRETFCVKVVDAYARLASVDEMSRRIAIPGNASQMKRGKIMIHALNHDYINVETGEFIERAG